ncbi:protein-disulfide reductase DsbD domain-containing protein [Roseinatronobacter alkalisoli]|uniref:Protein-disulfide reductase DsbD family protein n=1 Tax=Roseinatronobacter alkalisoli TaxID=3028235 RepID=A0ABT5TCF6_9RHOB|nr:protein-disulfide reductase DsbD domain-containing protein [Roseinatronobacter sp. HJB301]MDD7972380.1 protein-disulfide reductase DsbD family protein [Roseinatronobacter sp. HJB301]
MKICPPFRALALAAALLSPFAVQAQSPAPSDLVQAGIRPGWKTASGTYIAALHLKLSPDWITYWRHPGESGIAPRLDWGASSNLAHVRVHWPEPRLFLKAGFNSIGYAGELVLPVELTPQDAAAPISFDATLSIGVCNDICVPVDLRMQTSLNGGGQHDSVIASALTHRPGTARAAGLRGLTCALDPDSRGLRLSVQMDIPSTGNQEFLLVELPGQGARSHVLPSHREGGTITGQTRLRTKSGQVGAIDRSAIKVSLVSENGTLSHQGCSLAP